QHLLVADDDRGHSGNLQARADLIDLLFEALEPLAVRAGYRSGLASRRCSAAQTQCDTHHRGQPGRTHGASLLDVKGGFPAWYERPLRQVSSMAGSSTCFGRRGIMGSAIPPDTTNLL